MKHLVVYGTDNYKSAINSLIESGSKFFDKIHRFGPQDIDKNFQQKNNHILNLRRGAGYWLWKPYFIKKVLSDVNDDEIIFYVDAGNIFLNDPSVILNRLEKNDGIVLFDNRDSMRDGNPPPNKNWTKKDAFTIMNLDSETHRMAKHCNASYQIYKKNQKSLSFVDEYLFWSQNANVITDAANISGHNYSGFIDHRHDQSILSLLASKYMLHLEVDPSEHGNICGCRDYPQMFLHHRNPYYVLK